jgi:hypothetical protein
MFTKSGLLLHTDCNHCMSANAFSSSFLSIASPSSDLAYLVAIRTLDIALSALSFEL